MILRDRSDLDISVGNYTIQQKKINWNLRPATVDFLVTVPINDIILQK